MMDLLFRGDLDLSRLNNGVIILIPKVTDANTLKHFRPICLLNVCLLITKILTRRLTKVAYKVIDPCQTAFVLGRNILDGVVILHEVLQEMAYTKQSGIILKLDYEKAYDKVNRGFMEKVLQRKGFHDTWITWVMGAVKIVRVAVNVNGDQRDFFRTSRGLRQGDPLSPLLFNIVGDALSEMIKSARNKGHLRGVVPHLFLGG